LADVPTPQLPVLEVEDPGLDVALGGGFAPFIGATITRPFRRDLKQDWANEDGVALITAAIGQILGTMSDSPFATGELPWRTEFGSQLYALRQRLNDEVLPDIARRFVVQAIERWEPRVQVTEAHVAQVASPSGDNTVMVIRIKFDILNQLNGTNATLAQDLQTAVVV
jgi:phage baseplate assembly protein W